MRHKDLFIISVFSLSLYGCNIIGYSHYGDCVEGDWHDSAGMISTFAGGEFQTYTPDTEEKLSEGTYNIDEDNPSSINIVMKSLVKGTVNEVNCNLDSRGKKLYCSSIITSKTTQDPNIQNSKSKPTTKLVNFELKRM